MNIVNEFISSYGTTIIEAIMAFVITYVANYAKKFFDNKTKQDVAITCVKAIEQIYDNLHGDEKLKECTEAMSAMLEEKGIYVTELEINMLIHSTLADLNKKFEEVFGEGESEAPTEE